MVNIRSCLRADSGHACAQHDEGGEAAEDGALGRSSGRIGPHEQVGREIGVDRDQIGGDGIDQAP